MRLMRNRAGLFAVLALTWHLITIAAVGVVLTVDLHATSDEQGMENCPLHSKPACPLHAEKHGTHDCDCPTIACAQTDTGLAGLFGPAGVLPVIISTPAPSGVGDAAPGIARSAHPVAPVPLSPPPRA